MYALKPLRRRDREVERHTPCSLRAVVGELPLIFRMVLLPCRQLTQQTQIQAQTTSQCPGGRFS